MDTTLTRVDFDELEWRNPMKGCRVKTIVRNQRQLRLLEISREFVEPDWCRRAHYGMVLRGELEVDFRGRTERFPEGSAVAITAGEEFAHKARAVTPTVTLFLVEEP